LVLEKTQTIFELKALLTSAIDVEFSDVNLILENYGLLDSEDSLDLPLEIIGLENNRYYSLFVYNKNSSDNTWKIFCSEKIIGKAPLTQQGFIFCGRKNTPVCFACKNICRANDQVSEVILENNFYCLCSSDMTNGRGCLFSGCDNFLKIQNKELAFKNANSLLLHHAKELYIREKTRIESVNKETLERSFDFERSSKFGLQRVMMYNHPDVKNKVLSILPLDELKVQAEENSNKTNLHPRDELVKSLLHWFKYKFFSWCNKARCPVCKNESDAKVGTETPSAEESQWLASRTEVFKCTRCNTINRFPRYNNPSKLCDTKTGRCGEYANLFGCILSNLDFEVRFIDNFEDHVWNEYFSNSLGRWVHVDSCENAWDTPLLYEQGWGRNMTFIVAYSHTGVYDLTRRYVKDWDLIASRRRQTEIDRLNKNIELHNNMLRENIPAEQIESLYLRDITEQVELLKVKTIQEAELTGRQSGSEEWRKERGEIK
jgi:peptide-N4-(N-acetyl-beta-glucosaminyl)asparagine amidase